MKTSNKFIVLAAFTLFISLGLYNLALKVEYSKGAYMDKFYNYKKLDLKGFDKIEISAGNIVDLKIVKSDSFDIRVNNRDKDLFTIEKTGSKLIVKVKDSLNDAHNLARVNGIVIFCPKVDSLNIKGQIMTYYKGDKKLSNYPAQDFKQTKLEGFALSSLFVSLGDNCTLNLKNNRIGRFNSDIGAATSTGAHMIVERTNKIDSATFRVESENKLSLSPQINHITYTYANNAIISLNGPALSLLKKP